MTDATIEQRKKLGELHVSGVLTEAEFDVAEAEAPGSVRRMATEAIEAIPLRDKIAEAGGVAVADEWIHLKDLVAVGLQAAEEAEAEASPA
jgi:hypothetical protein